MTCSALKTLALTLWVLAYARMTAVLQRSRVNGNPEGQKSRRVGAVLEPHRTKTQPPIRNVNPAPAPTQGLALQQDALHRYRQRS